MADKEKVIKGVQNLRDAIAFDYIRETDHAVETLDNALALLKEQEAVEPRTKPSGGWLETKTLYFCGACGARISKRKTKYCQECGTAVKWE